MRCRNHSFIMCHRDNMVFELIYINLAVLLLVRRLLLLLSVTFSTHLYVERRSNTSSSSSSFFFLSFEIVRLRNMFAFASIYVLCESNKRPMFAKRARKHAPKTCIHTLIKASSPCTIWKTIDSFK